MSNFDPLDTHGQERDKAADAERSRANAERDVDDLKWLMSNKRGRRFVFRVLERARVYSPSFNTNALVMAFTDGQKNEGVRLLAQLTTHCPDRYLEMLEESKK